MLPVVAEDLPLLEVVVVPARLCLTAPEAPALDRVAMVLAGALAAAPPDPTFVALADCVISKD